MFGTYISKDELLVYSFLKLLRDHNREYRPAQFGFGPDEAFLDNFCISAQQIFIISNLTMPLE